MSSTTTSLLALPQSILNQIFVEAENPRALEVNKAFNKAYKIMLNTMWDGAMRKKNLSPHLLKMMQSITTDYPTNICYRFEALQNKWSHKFNNYEASEIFYKIKIEHKNSCSLERFIKMQHELDSNTTLLEKSKAFQIKQDDDATLRAWKEMERYGKYDELSEEDKLKQKYTYVSAPPWHDFIPKDYRTAKINNAEEVRKWMKVEENQQHLLKFTSFSIRKFGIKKFPEEICNLTNVTYLSLQHNKIREIPDGIKKLINLASLYLDHNKIENLPAALLELKHLKTLDVTNNSISTITKECELFLQNLEQLGFSNNPITQSALEKFKKTGGSTLLNLNILSQVHADVNLLKIWNPIQKELNLRGIDPSPIEIRQYLKKTLEKKPEETFSQVTGLNLSELELTEIPPELFYFKSLESLNLSRNAITQIPKEIVALKNLTYLSVCKNKISSIPPCIQELKELKQLAFVSNLLKTLPIEVTNLNIDSDYFSWENNPFNWNLIPEAVIKKFQMKRPSEINSQTSTKKSSLKKKTKDSKKT